MELNKKRRTFPLYLQIILGMVLGIIIGIVAVLLDAGKLVNHWLVPWGQMFIRLLQLIAVPLIFVTLVKGITGLKDIRKFSQLGGKMMLLYLCFIAASAAFGIMLAVTVKPGSLVKHEVVEDIQKQYQANIEEKTIAAEQNIEQGPLNFLNDIIPNNIINAASNNANILQVIFFSVFFAMSILLLPAAKTKPVVEWFDALEKIILKMVDFIIKTTPVGVVALMAGLIVDFKGDISMFSALGVYALTVIVGLLIIMYVIYPIVIHFFARNLKTSKFLRALYPVQLFAFTTSSSAATLPVTMKAVREDLEVSEEVAEFVLPIGVTINMDGTACYQAVAIVFIAQVLGIDLSLWQLVVVLFMTILSSIGTPGIPGGTYVILAMVLTSIGIPPEGLALIIGIDRPLDMLRTSVNVTGDATVACMIDKNKG
ncbi:MAG: dicarboxylate/amino acid:cation symporter [Tannerella sp.]|jgi:Na+/H+-dicarboxylate symporter|nr:dicarboxylate/amino acid:cation symporter [Tannerella sp.]